MTKLYRAESNAREIANAISNCGEAALYLKNYLSDTIESVGDQLRIYTDTLNTYFEGSPKVDEFDFLTNNQGRFTVFCGCGWGIFIALVDDSDLAAASGLLQECLDQMLMHTAEHLKQQSIADGEARITRAESETMRSVSCPEESCGAINTSCNVLLKCETNKCDLHAYKPSGKRPMPRFKRLILNCPLRRTISERYKRGDGNGSPR